MFYRINNRRMMSPRHLIWRNLNNIQDGNEFLLGGTRGPLRQQYPPINAYLGEDGLVITAELPGLNPDMIDVSIVADTLTLSGNQPKQVTDEDAAEVEFIRHERPEGNFSRTISLPFEIDIEAVKANLDNGILRLELPRLPEEKPKRISINVG